MAYHFRVRSNLDSYRCHSVSKLPCANHRLPITRSTLPNHALNWFVEGKILLCRQAESRNSALRCKLLCADGSKGAVASKMRAPWLANCSQEVVRAQSTFARCGDATAGNLLRRLEGINYETFRTWQSEKPVFSVAIKKAEAECKVARIVTVLKASKKVIGCVLRTCAPSRCSSLRQVRTRCSQIMLQLFFEKSPSCAALQEFLSANRIHFVWIGFAVEQLP